MHELAAVLLEKRALGARLAQPLALGGEPGDQLLQVLNRVHAPLFWAARPDPSTVGSIARPWTST